MDCERRNYSAYSNHAWIHSQNQPVLSNESSFLVKETAGALDWVQTNAWQVYFNYVSVILLLFFWIRLCRFCVVIPYVIVIPTTMANDFQLWRMSEINDWMITTNDRLMTHWMYDLELNTWKELVSQWIWKQGTFANGKDCFIKPNATQEIE